MSIQDIQPAPTHSAQPNIYQWPKQGTQPFVCTHKWQQTPQSMSIRLIPAPNDPQAGSLISFKPGQFVNLGLEINQKMHFRAYSISSAPDEDHLTLTIKRVENGLVSNAICDLLQVGDSVELMAPQGEFHLQKMPTSQSEVVLISAGCGATPVLSMLRQLVKKASYQTLNQNTPTTDVKSRSSKILLPYAVSYIHSAKVLEEVPFYDELLALSHQVENFTLSIKLTQEFHPHYPNGRISLQDIQNACPQLEKSAIFLCGPNAFMASIQGMLETSGFNMQHFFQESFTPAKPEGASAQQDNTHENGLSDESSTNNKATQYQVSAPSFAASATIQADQPLIESLEAMQLPVIAACRSGVCGSCKCKVKGETESTSSMTLSEEEVEQGYRLACSTYAKSDLEVTLG